MNEQHLLALVGSPRAKSTSEMLARYLCAGLAARGWQTNVQQISPAIRQAGRWSALEQQFLRADVIALVFPLYVDSLPAATTLALERLAAVHRAGAPRQTQRLLAVVNCGFFEAQQNDVALAICQQFAVETGLSWSGGLAIGGGGALNGRSLQTDKMVMPLATALNMAVDAVHAGAEIPAEALALARRKLMPSWLYFTMANLGMRLGALRQHNLRRINAQPYLAPFSNSTLRGSHLR